MHAPATPRSATPIRSSGAAIAYALPALLAVGLALRLHGIAFGLPALNDPDELTFELGALKMLAGPTLNPGWFGHPATTTMYVLAMITVAVYGVGHLFGNFPTVNAFAEAIYADPSWVILPGRIAMVLFAVGTIYLTYRLACELFDRRTGLLAAVLITVNPVHITWSQIIRSDMMACFFMLLCMIAALRIAHQDRWRDHVLAALWLSAAIATKWPYAITALSVFGAVVLRMGMFSQHRLRDLRRLVMFGVITIGLLLLISPYLLLDRETVLRNLQGEAQLHHLGATGGAPWENAWWYLSGPILTGTGVVGLCLVAWGLAIISRRAVAIAVLLPVMFGFFVLLAVQNLVWERWALPFSPLLAICGAVGLASLVTALKRFQPPPLAPVVGALILAASVVPLFMRANADARARLDDTRQRAAHWAELHIPAGSTVLIEHFAFDMLPRPWTLLFPAGDAGCVDVRAMLNGKVQLRTAEAVRGSRSNVDYGTLAPSTRETCLADYAILTQADRYAAEHNRFPAEHTAYTELLRRGTEVAVFAPRPGKIGGPLVRIIHFSR